MYMHTLFDCVIFIMAYFWTPFLYWEADEAEQMSAATHVNKFQCI